MKITTICCCLLVSLSAFAEEFPKRKPGLWQIQTAIEGLPVKQTMKHCIDAASDAKMAQMGQGLQAGADCTRNETRKEGDNFVAESECTSGGIKMISKTIFSGDFSSQYSGNTIIKYEPAMMGMPEQKMSLTAKWTGPCEPGQEPGDIIMPDGTKMNIN